MSVARYIVAGLGAAASVSAAPYNSTTTTAPSYTATLSTVYGSSTSATSTIPNIAASDAATVGKAAASELTNVARFNQLLTVNGQGTELLPSDQLRQRTVFDFNQAKDLNEGGRFLAANVGNFPLLVDQGLSTAMAFLGPCGMNSPHTHPRAAEWLTVVEGSLRTGFMLENGFLANAADGGRLTTEVDTRLDKFQGTLFPMGSIHYQFNDSCDNATFVATLSSEDPGTSQVAQNFFFQDEEIVEIVLGEVQTINGQDIDEFRASLPANLVKAVDTCKAMCGM